MVNTPTGRARMTIAIWADHGAQTLRPLDF